MDVKSLEKSDLEPANLPALSSRIAKLEAGDRLKFLLTSARNSAVPSTKKSFHAVFSTSLGVEDQVILHLLHREKLLKNVGVFTLDTGRLFPETYSLLETTVKHYGADIKVYFPNWENVEKYVQDFGINGFFHSPENRKRCCSIRKIEPLKRALTDFTSGGGDGDNNGGDGGSGGDGSGGEKLPGVWITGLRADQSENRSYIDFFQWDSENEIVKFHPLADWTYQQCLDFCSANSVPISKLVEKGFVSIGCAPCTRAISKGESFRDGRWWWEDKSKKECGLHFSSSKV